MSHSCKFILRTMIAAFIFPAIVFILSSCGTETTTENLSDAAIDSGDLVSSADTFSASEDFFYSLPSPLVMARIFKKTGLKYAEGIANQPENASRYVTTQSRSLNLGVYSADLAYTVLNKQTQQATQYMESVKRLSDELGMASMFDTEGYLTRFKSNLNEEDSLINIVCQLKGEMDIFMQDNEKEKLTLLIFIGAWVENMYIATQLTKEANKDKIAMRVAEQKHILNNLMNLISRYQNDAEFHNLFSALNELKVIFDNLTVQGEEDNLVMDKLQLKAITEKVSNLRKDITG